MSKAQIRVLCTTDRDGNQGEKINLSMEEKALVAMVMDRLGIAYVEGGWPGANPTDTALFNNQPVMEQAKMAAFTMTCRAGMEPDQDPNFSTVVNTDVPTICLFGKTWDAHVHEALQIPLEKNLEIIAKSVAYAKKQGKEVVYDAEHFFDGWKNNKDYALKTLKAAAEAGADWIVLCDTNGGTMPYEVDEAVREVVKEFPNVKFGIHAHNDCECAVANTVMAVRSGCTMVHGTLLGIGERCGNANLFSVLSVLKFKMDLDVGVKDSAMRCLAGLARWFASVVGKEVPDTMPFVGRSAFAHKGGVHVSAVKKNPALYEHMSPDLVGNKRRIPMSDQGGGASLCEFAKGYGLDLSRLSKPEMKELIDFVNEKEKEGYTYDLAPDSLAVQIARRLFPSDEPFSMVAHNISIKGVHEADNGDHDDCHAVTKLVLAGKVAETKGQGSGPVDALDKAVRERLLEAYPELNDLELVDFRVDLADKHAKTGAKTRVHITSLDKETGRLIETMGVSTNIVRASLLALADADKFKIMQTDRLLCPVVDQETAFTPPALKLRGAKTSANLLVKTL